MVEFLLISDIEESTLFDSDTKSRLPGKYQQRFLDETNNWYTTEALELGVDEDDIITYNPNVDVTDTRNYTCIKLAEYYFLKIVFLSLHKKEDDVFILKYKEICRLFDNLISKLTYNRITGVSPSQLKSPNGFSTILRYRGEY